MGLFNWLFGRGKSEAPPRFDLAELARRLGATVHELRDVRPVYHRFGIPKRSGGTRTILAPDPKLKALQRRVLRRVLGRLKAHPAARGFERGQSIVTNARPHAGKAVVLRMDVKEFFGATTAGRVEAFLRHIGWDAEATAVLCRLCTYQGALPQGAPTSPRLSNLLNHALDERLAAIATIYGCDYTRYADDITFSRAEEQASGGQHTNPKTLAAVGDSGRTNDLIGLTKSILADYGYALHHRKKLQIRRQHQRQAICGLVVNRQVNLPRHIRRRLRAVEHHLAAGRPTTLTPAQLDGWRALQAMIRTQREAPPGGSAGNLRP